MAVTGPNTGFVIVNADGGPNNQDLGSRYVSKDYLIDVYPNIVNTLGALNSPGLLMWGYNTNGQLGLNNTVNSSSPVQVGSLTNWKLVSAGRYYSAAIKTDGTLWSWGYNIYGQLGQNDVTSRSSPTQVGALTNWKQVTTGFYHTAAIKTDGTLWTWGRNSYGQLGLNNTVHRSSPVQVGSLTNWKQVSCGATHAEAIKTDGTLWTWGGNGYYGGLGLNDTTNRSSPTQVGSLSNWKLVSAGKYYSAAIKTDGTLWSWGYNFLGQLGLNDTVHRSSPTQVGALTNWKLVASGYYQMTAIKTDGTLWTWGYNFYGELGINDTTNRSSPVQVGSLTNWKLVASGSGYHQMTAIKTDGTLWTWGYNFFGQLGLNNTVHRSSPVQVGALTNWKQVTTGFYFSAAIQDGYY